MVKKNKQENKKAERMEEIEQAFNFRNIGN